MTPERARRWALALLCLSLPLSIAGTNIAAGLLTGALLWRGASKALPWRALRRAALWALGAYCAAALISALLGHGPALSLARLPKDLHKVWIAAILSLALAEDPFREAPLFLGAGFAVAAAAGLGQALWSLRTGNLARASAFVHPVTLGEQLAFCALGLACVLGWPRPSGKAWPWARWAWALALLCWAALFFNHTRAALAGLALGGLVLAGLEPRIRTAALLTVLGAELIVFAWENLPAGKHSLAALLAAGAEWSPTGPVNPVVARLALWSAAAAMFRAHPWTGVGLGHYRTLFPSYFQGKMDNEEVWGNAHNLYLHHLAERGLLGFAALVAVLGVLLVTAWRRARRAPGPGALWAAAALPAFLVMNLTEVAFQNELVSTLLLFVWAWGTAQPEARRGRDFL